MTPLKPKRLKTVAVNLNEWTEHDDGSLRSGNVLLRCDEVYFIGDYRCERWFIYLVGADSRITRVAPKSRQWGYGSSGAAKIGAAHIVKPVELEGGKGDGTVCQAAQNSESENPNGSEDDGARCSDDAV